MKTKVTKLIVVFLLLSIFVSTLSSCASAPIKTGKQANAVVGVVDSYEIPYDEFYFLAHNYSDTIKDAQKVQDLVYDNIVSNYAILKLCEEAGLSMDSKDIKDAIQTSLDAYIESNFDGKRSQYKKYLKENGMTDRYVRFSLGIDILYSRLAAEYVKDGVSKTMMQASKK